MIEWLDRAAAPTRVGGKGASLGRLVRAGLPVPPGFCVTVTAMQALDEPAATAPIAEALARLSPGPLAVRSSALGEDGATASFAGIHLSLLNVARGAVSAALARVRDSARSPAALAYRKRRNIAGEPRIAAVVQSMVAPEVSGVLFTRHPVTREPAIVVEASWGLGEAIVSGSVTPDHFELDVSGAVLRSVVADKDVACVPGDDGTVEVEVPAERRRVACVNESQLRTIAAVGRECERLFGAPQDVEWALEGDRIWLLQSRPITT